MITIPARFEDEYPDVANFMMMVFSGGGKFTQPKNGEMVTLPKFPPITRMKRNSRCPCGSGKKTKSCHVHWTSK